MKWLLQSSNAPISNVDSAMKGMSDFWTKDKPISRPMRYIRSDAGWTNTGAFNLAGKENPVTTPFIFDDAGVLKWLNKNWGAITAQQ